jgi:hypothetical protein
MSCKKKEKVKSYTQEVQEVDMKYKKHSDENKPHTKKEVISVKLATVVCVNKRTHRIYNTPNDAALGSSTSPTTCHFLVNRYIYILKKYINMQRGELIKLCVSRCSITS